MTHACAQPRVSATTAGEQQPPVRRRRLSAAAAHDDLAVDQDIGDAGQVAMRDRVGRRWCRSSPRPARRSRCPPARRPRARRRRGRVRARCCRSRWRSPRRARSPQTEQSSSRLRSMPRGITPVPPGVSVPSGEARELPLVGEPAHRAHGRAVVAGRADLEPKLVWSTTASRSASLIGIGPPLTCAAMSGCSQDSTS